MAVLPCDKGRIPFLIHKLFAQNALSLIASASNVLSKNALFFLSFSSYLNVLLSMTIGVICSIKKSKTFRITKVHDLILCFLFLPRYPHYYILGPHCMRKLTVLMSE